MRHHVILQMISAPPALRGMLRHARTGSSQSGRQALFWGRAFARLAAKAAQWFQGAREAECVD